jgi:hypothetical protein
MKKTVIPFLVICIVLLLGILTTLVKLSSKTSPQSEYISSNVSNVSAMEVEQTEEVKEENVEEKAFSVSVCDFSSCVWISSDGLVNNGVVDQNAVYQKVLDSVIPYFENKYGGKTFVKNRGGEFIYWRYDNIPDFSNIYDKVYEAFKSGTDSRVEIEIKDLPATDGRYADKYIEVDDSKLKLYAWVDGKVVKEIDLSPAKKGYQVYGVFPIIDKGVAPIAPGGKYMPYWMAFYYSPKQDSYYGLHGLIWWYDGNGKKVYETEEHIGVRRSKGCIRMTVENAKFLYNIYQKGDPVLIHE